jgi:hypothetical protein
VRFGGLPITPAPTSRTPTQAIAVGPLGTVDVRISAADNDSYLHAIGEPHPYYRTDAVAHPAGLLRLVNLILMSSVELGPRIHTTPVIDVAHTAVYRLGGE